MKILCLLMAGVVVGWQGIGGVQAEEALIFSDIGTPPEAAKDLSELALTGVDIESLFQPKISVNNQTREAALAFYNTYYLGSTASEGRNTGWTGNRATCTPGTTSSTFKNAILNRVNYFRAMAGVSGTVAFDSGYSAKAQQAALMMSRNNTIDHTPPASWACYTADGANAADKSNLHIHWGTYMDPITAYMRDQGSASNPSVNKEVGHRRCILYPQTQYMGTGDVPEGGGYGAANALWVQDANIWGARPAPRDNYVAWPPPGYVPYTVVFGRWSFSLKDANFSGATVSMTQNGSPISATIDARISNVNTYPENSIVWRPFGVAHDYVWPRPSADTVYAVTIRSVVVGGVSRDFSYVVRVFDPAGGGVSVPGAPTLNAPANGAAVSGTTVAFNWYTPSGNPTKYHLQISRYSNFSTLAVNHSTLTSTSQSVGSFPNSGATYYWRVRAYNASGWGSWSAVRYFVNGSGSGTRPGAPALSSPPHNYRIPGTQIVFSWGKASGNPTRYQLLISRRSDFATTLLNHTATTRSRTVTGLPNNGTWLYWVVRAYNSAGWGPWSRGRYFYNHPVDAYEPDDTSRAAKTVRNGRTQWRSIAAVGNRDWARFTVGSRGGRNLDIQTWGLSGDTQIWLFTSRGRQIGYDDDNGTGRFSRLWGTSIPGGTYYLAVQEYGNNGIIPSYKLRVKWTPR